MDIGQRFENLFDNKRLLMINSAACLILSMILIQIFLFNVAQAFPDGLEVEKEEIIFQEKVEIGNPKKIQIPQIEVEAPIQKVGIDKEGNMGIPANPSAVGWFELGPKPGNMGNAVIAGHLDTVKSEAVFWNLKKLKPGDRFNIIDENNNEITFKVTRIVSYALDEAPADMIFGENSNARLNLITCDGSWNWQKHTYNRRLVVFSEKV